MSRNSGSSSDGQDSSAKILLLEDVSLEQLPPEAGRQILLDNMLAYARSVARPTTEFVVNFVDKNCGATFTPTIGYSRIFLAVEMVERVRQAEADGYDATFPGMCYAEVFLQDARQAVRMPVVGPAESSMMLAQLLGKKFAVVTVAERYEYVMDENIRSHGLQNCAVSPRPVRSWPADTIDLILQAYAGRPERLIEEFDREAQKCVRDGADVVICGCNPYGVALGQVGYKEVSGTGVPVVIPLAAQIKVAEMLIDLRRSCGLAKSEALVGAYRSTPPEVLEDLEIRGICLSDVRPKTSQGAEQRVVASAASPV